MPTDPTQSTAKRQRVQREFHSRWRTVRGNTRRELTGGSYYRPQNERSIGRQTAAFREWIETELDETVVEPVYSRRQVERGEHWTGRIVREFYEHGIRLAHRHLTDAGASHPALDANPDAILRRDNPRWGGDGHHHEYLTEDYDEIYTDVVDVARETAKQAYREYRNAARSGATVSETLSRINDRVEKVGSTRTDLVARTKLVQVINDAVIRRYEELGVSEVGVDIEVPTDAESGRVATDGGTHSQLADTTHDAGDDLAEYHQRGGSGTGRNESDGQVRQVFETAGDDRVCPECAFFDGVVYTVEEIAAGSVPSPPLHPNCRCVWRLYDISGLGWA